MIRRVLLLLTVVALMAAMMGMSAVSASATIIIELDKDFCKETKGAFFFKNQGQCIKAVNNL